MQSPQSSPGAYVFEEDAPPTGWRWWLPRSLGVLGFLTMAVFWIWAFNNQDSIAHPDEFNDPAFSMTAETLCLGYQETIRSFPLATAATGPEERGELIAAGTRELSAMVDELGTLGPPNNAKGADGVEQWLEEYQIYLNDRRRYTDVLRSGEDPPFTISGNSQGVRVTDLLTTFADVNNMASCGPSGDV